MRPLVRLAYNSVRFIQWSGEYSYRNPCCTVGCVAAIYLHNIYWVMFAISALFLEYTFTGLGALTSTMTNLQDARDTFLTPGCGFLVTQLRTEDYERLATYAHIDGMRKFERVLLATKAGEQPKVAVFRVKRVDRKLFLRAKAYTNSGGTSLVFIKDVPVQVRHRFKLLHELSHTSDGGSFQLTDIYAFWLPAAYGCVFLEEMATNWTTWVIAVLYGCSIPLIHFYLPVHREIVADNDALRRLATDEEKLEALRMLNERLESRQRKANEWRERREISCRLYHAAWFRSELKRKMELVVHWNGVPGGIAGLALLCSGVTSVVAGAEKPLFLLGTMILFIARGQWLIWQLVPYELALQKEVQDALRKVK